jgi:two-component system KDP operon response regulator KdpE
VDGLRIDFRDRLVERDGQPIHLTPTEWGLLRVLVLHAGRLLGHAQIFREVWPGSPGDAQAYLRVHISNLRRKLERDPVRPRLITTEAGVGYRFRALD